MLEVLIEVFKTRTKRLTALDTDNIDNGINDNNDGLDALGIHHIHIYL